MSEAGCHYSQNSAGFLETMQWGLRQKKNGSKMTEYQQWATHEPEGRPQTGHVRIVQVQSLMEEDCRSTVR